MAQVNGHPAEPGCYVASQWGQYGPDQAIEVAESFGHTRDPIDDPRIIRHFADMTGWDHLADQYHWADDATIEWLNAVTDLNHTWIWQEGELFLIPITELEDQ
jgi:hypothetical protein